MPSGKYLVMTYSLTIAPAIFQSLVNDILDNMLNVFVYHFNGMVHRSHLIYRKAQAVLYLGYQRSANLHSTPAPWYRVGQKVELSTWNMPV